jgi:hypothetical protein
MGKQNGKTGKETPVISKEMPESGKETLKSGKQTSTQVKKAIQRWFSNWKSSTNMRFLLKKPSF